MNDLYREILVKQKQSPVNSLKRTAIVALTVILAAGGFFVNIILLIPAIAAGIGAYFVVSRYEKEYEYLYVNGDFDIDVIYNKQKRKRIASYDADALEVFAPEKSSHLDEYRGRDGISVKDYTSLSDQAKVWCGVYNIDNGRVLVRYEFDDDELISDLRRKAPRKVFMM